MKTLLLTLTAALGLITTAGNSNAQDSQTTVSHSSTDAFGNVTTVSHTVYNPPPPPTPDPPLAMYDRAMDSKNPVIAVNDPIKDGHPARKGPVWNHDGQAFANYDPRSFLDSREYACAFAPEYHKNIRSTTISTTGTINN